MIRIGMAAAAAMLVLPAQAAQSAPGCVVARPAAGDPSRRTAVDLRLALPCRAGAARERLILAGLPGSVLAQGWRGAVTVGDIPGYVDHGQDIRAF